MNPVEKYAALLESKANETVWLPPKINPDGTVANIIQGRVIPRGADQGETNYKTRKQPSKYGQFETPEVGTFVANMHYDVDVEGNKKVNPLTGKQYVEPTKELVADGDGEIRILKYGKTVRIKNGLGWDKIAGKSLERAAQKLRDGDVHFMKTADDSQTQRAGMVKCSAENIANVSTAGRTVNQ